MSTPAYTQWQVGKTYSFSTMATGLLASNYSRVKLNGVVDYDVARLVEAEDVYAKWRTIFPHLAPGTPNDPGMSNWYIFKSADGKAFALAEEWINGSTVQPVEFVSYVITVTNSSNVEMGRIRDILNSIGATFMIGSIT